MTHPSSLLYLILAAFAVGCNRQGHDIPSETHHVRDPSRYETSLIQLLANPQAHHGKKVQIRGVYFSGEETSMIAPSRELGAAAANCIWIDFLGSPVVKDREPPAHGEWATLVGTFDAQSHGHLSRFAATIRDIEGFAYTPSWIESLERNTANKAPEPTP